MNVTGPQTASASPHWPWIVVQVVVWALLFLALAAARQQLEAWLLSRFQRRDAERITASMLWGTWFARPSVAHFMSLLAGLLAGAAIPLLPQFQIQGWSVSQSPLSGLSVGVLYVLAMDWCSIGLLAGRTPGYPSRRNAVGQNTISAQLLAAVPVMLIVLSLVVTTGMLQPWHAGTLNLSTILRPPGQLGRYALAGCSAAASVCAVDDLCRAAGSRSQSAHHPRMASSCPEPCAADYCAPGRRLAGPSGWPLPRARTAIHCRQGCPDHLCLGVGFCQSTPCRHGLRTPVRVASLHIAGRAEPADHSPARHGPSTALRAEATMRSGMPPRTTAKDLLQVVRAMHIALRRGFGKRIRPAASLPFRRPPFMREDASGRPVCTACGACVDACPTSAIRISQTQGIAQLHLDWRRCACCSICLWVCPAQALDVQTGFDTPFVICADRGGVCQ